MEKEHSILVGKDKKKDSHGTRERKSPCIHIRHLMVKIYTERKIFVRIKIYVIFIYYRSFKVEVLFVLVVYFYSLSSILCPFVIIIIIIFASVSVCEYACFCRCRYDDVKSKVGKLYEKLENHNVCMNIKWPNKACRNKCN